MIFLFFKIIHMNCGVQVFKQESLRRIHICCWHDHKIDSKWWWPT